MTNGWSLPVGRPRWWLWWPSWWASLPSLCFSREEAAEEEAEPEEAELLRVVGERGAGWLPPPLVTSLGGGVEGDRGLVQRTCPPGGS